MGDLVDNGNYRIHSQPTGLREILPNRHRGSQSVDDTGPAMAFPAMADQLVAARDGERSEWEDAWGPAKSWLLSQPTEYQDLMWDTAKDLADQIEIKW